MIPNKRLIKKQSMMYGFIVFFFFLFVLQYRTIAEDCFPQTPNEMDSESILSDQLEITNSDFMDSSSCTEEELSVCEMVIINYCFLLRYNRWLNTYMITLYEKGNTGMNYIYIYIYIIYF